MALDNPLISRELKQVRFTATLRDTKHWMEAYLFEDSLTEKRFAIVERINVNSRGGANDFEAWHTDDRDEAERLYAAAEARVKAAILVALR